MMQRSLKLLAVSTMLAAFGASHAFAQDANLLGERIKATLQKQGISIDWSNITQNGSQTVLEGVTFGAPNNPTRSAPIGNVTLDGVTEAGGGYTIGTTTFPNFSGTDQGVDYAAEGITITGLKIPSEGETNPIANLMLYDSAEVKSVTVRQGGTDFFTMNDLRADIDQANDQAMTFTADADRFTANLGAIPDPKTKAVVEAMGYQNIAGDLKMRGSWAPSDGRMQLTQYDINVENAGTLGMTIDIGGYTPQLIQSLQDLQTQMAAQAPGADNSAQGMAMLGLMQQITFSSMSVRFSDDSLTQKVIDFVAKQQGVQPSDIVNQAKAIVPFATAQLQNPALSEQVTQAVSRFLDDPSSFEIAARPAQPVPVAQIAGTASGNPLELLKQLNVTVTANEAAAAPQ
ncbi:MAG: hypothetical protein DI629_04415 [Mesorhizobium amorphae]|nr:MAG: hypothetical protein DI629_04415 [Mesorhizobium amorphae]